MIPLAQLQPGPDNMSETIDSLVRMANQIARNLAFEKDPVAATLDHIVAFWDPRMKQQIVAEDNLPLTPVAAEAISRLRLSQAAR